MKKYLLLTLILAVLALGGIFLLRSGDDKAKVMAKPAAPVIAEETAKDEPQADAVQTESVEDDSEPELEDVALDGPYERLLIKPKSDESEKELKTLLKSIRHEFKGKFTADVPNDLLDEVKTLADVESVAFYDLHDTSGLLATTPVCGNGIAEGGEKCGEPRLNCKQNQICTDCKCLTPEEPVGRLCSPANQIEYNISQVNGGSGGAGIKVAVLDSGIDTDHPDLVGRIKDCKDTTKRGLNNGCSDTSSTGHGTHTAGIIAADGGSDGLGLIGAAPEAELMVIKVCGRQGCYSDDIAEAIYYAAQNGAHIVNMSFGGPSESTLIKEAIAANPDVLYVASAGNSGPASDTIEYPAANPAVVAVAANDSAKVMAIFSSRGIDDGNDDAIAEREVELTAGGVEVESTDNNGCYDRLSGTSFSAPTIAGLAAKVWQESASATRRYLMTIARDITEANGGGVSVGFDTASGYGLPVAP